MNTNYNEKVIKYFRDPKNVGEIENPSGKGSEGNPTCGDIMEITIKVEKNIITDAKFKTFGCAAAIATSSILTELAIGKNIQDAKELQKDDILNALGGLPCIKQHCSILGIKALKKAIDDYLNKSSKPKSV
jgi:nitrogen fixation protein NifU and related proteins